MKQCGRAGGGELGMGGDGGRTHTHSRKAKEECCDKTGREEGIGVGCCGPTRCGGQNTGGGVAEAARTAGGTSQSQSEAEKVHQQC